MSRKQRQARLCAILIGLAATTVVLAGYLRGGLDRLEWITLDLRFRHANSIAPAEEIVCLDITDRDLELVGRWPWPRDLQAPLIAIPAELGARALLVDITWTEPETTRTIDPEHADILAKLEELAEGEDAERVFPDVALAHAIAEAGNVYLAFHHSVVDVERSEAFREVVDQMLADNFDVARRLARDLEQRLRARMPDDRELALQRPFDRARLTVELLRDPTLDDVVLADRLGIGDPEFLERAYDRCLETALRWKLQDWLNEQPQRWTDPPDELVPHFFATLTSADFDGRSPLKSAVVRVYREVLGYAATTAQDLAPLTRVASIARPVDGLTPVHFLHARAARRCCFANFEPDNDGTVRKVALLERHGDRVLAQLGFAVGWDRLDVEGERVEASPGRMRLPMRDPARPAATLQLDGQGRTLIPWVRGREWVKQFMHLPASAVLRLHDLRRNASHNRREAAAITHMVCGSEFLPSFHQVARLLAERPAVERQADRHRLTGETELAAFFSEQLLEIDREVARAEEQLRAFAAEQQARGARGEPLADKLTLRALDDVVYYAGELERLRAASSDIELACGALEERLRPLFQGKICIVGYAATSLADMVPIPTHPRAPGYMAHANLLSGLLTGQLLRWATLPTNAALTVLLGTLSTVLAAFLRPRASLLLILALSLAFLLLGGWLFHQQRYWLGLTPPLAAVALSYVLIAVYRYIFVEGERRHLATALGQYTSRQIARQMAENPELCRKAEMREVTAMFTDLKGFTGISERIGAQRTQQVLNVTLGRFTEVFLRHEGMINKFIGDGVFAFWNPVIYPQDDHARRACETAIDLLLALDELKADQRRGNGDEVFEEIVLRVGIATGNAVVGPCGSEQKYDYTCIGDSVNVAARLESANKFYGTRILVNGDTRARVGAEFEFRALGGVRVKGKNVAVPVFELLGRAGAVATETLHYARRFNAGIELFQQRRWRQALDALQECQRLRPDDSAAVEYIRATTRYIDDPPDESWTGAIELTEK